MTANDIEQLRAVDIHLEVKIEASPDAVWAALTSDIARWWPRAAYCGVSSEGADSPRMEVELQPGGRMYEDWGSGDGLLWATVVNLTKGQNLELTGVCGPAWGGPHTWYGSYKLEPDGDGTKVRFSDSGFGRLSDDTLANKEKGWRYLLEAMRAHLEGRDEPAWDES